MRHPAMQYEPLDTLKRVAEGVWIVDGPIVRFGMPWPKMPFSTRMTIIRFKGGHLFVHSPTPLPPSLRVAVNEIGSVRWIVAPNRLHYSWVPAWHRAYSAASVYLAPGVVAQARGLIDFDADTLRGNSGYPWDQELRTIPVQGSFMTEYVFFHEQSRTLVLTDLIENFEASKLGIGPMRWIASMGGALDPDGSMPRDMRLTFRRSRRALREAVQTMIAWDPERIVLAHGRCYTQDATKELKRAFRWILT
jgi:hypothetical protein